MQRPGVVANELENLVERLGIAVTPNKAKTSAISAEISPIRIGLVSIYLFQMVALD